MKGKRGPAPGPKAPKKPRTKAAVEEQKKQTIAAATGSPPPGDNMPGKLTDEQRHALTAIHLGAYEKALKAKKKADADFKNACKLAKADLGEQAIPQIKLMIQLETPEGEAALKAKVQEQLQVMRWANVNIDFQGDLFPEVDRRDAEEKAFQEGKRAGLTGKSKQPPHHPGTPQYAAWMSGWEEGQTVVAGGFKPMPPATAAPSRDMDGLDPAPRTH